MGSHSDTLFTKAVPIALGMGVLLSPDTLTLLGNLMGNTGWAGLGLMLGAMVIFFIHAANVQTMDQSNLQTHFNGLVVYLPWTARVFTSVFLSTGILVSSGFVFNEVFLHWFPNFSFAFLILFLVLALHLLGTPIVIKAQVAFVAITILGLVLLILAGLFTTGNPVSPPVVHPPDRSLLFLPLLLWIGFDLGASAKRKGSLVRTIALSGVLFLLWAMVSIWHVPLEKLASSTIPHLKTARYLLGDTGRYIMGTIIIFGTLGAVNSLFMGCKNEASHLAKQGMLPQWITKYKMVVIFLSLVIGGMMAKGMAGSEHLETWIRAVFIFWLFSYGLLAVSVLKQSFSLANVMGFTLTMAGVILLLSEREQVLPVIYFIIILGTGLIPGMIRNYIDKKII